MRGIAHLDLARMNTDPDLNTQRGDRVDDVVRARDRGTRTGERRDETVTGRVHFATAEPLDFVAHDGVVVVQQVAPSVVAERGGVLGRADDVGKHDGGKHALGVSAAAHAGDEFLDFIEHRPGVANPVQGIGAG
ncbi:Uncharacterised protein [Mycobacterium tuberculosis]|nr:Uncharacterised protein [Mycobacterium tuberculosis]CNW60244.1 Uncharacterised protein [Mycobacterium tuberculosis]